MRSGPTWVQDDHHGFAPAWPLRTQGEPSTHLPTQSRAATRKLQKNEPEASQPGIHIKFVGGTRVLGGKGFSLFILFIYLF